MCLFGGSPSNIGIIIYVIYTYCKTNVDVEIENDMKHYKIDIREWTNKLVLNNYSFC